jgi:hypothetical protein
MYRRKMVMVRVLDSGEINGYKLTSLLITTDVVLSSD